MTVLVKYLDHALNVLVLWHLTPQTLKRVWENLMQKFQTGMQSVSSLAWPDRLLGAGLIVVVCAYKTVWHISGTKVNNVLRLPKKPWIMVICAFLRTNTNGNRLKKLLMMLLLYI